MTDALAITKEDREALKRRLGDHVWVIAGTDGGEIEVFRLDLLIYAMNNTNPSQRTFPAKWFVPLSAILKPESA
jgi:hypothetical protein